MVPLENGKKNNVATENDAECLLCQPLSKMLYIIHFIHTTNMSWCDYYPVLYIKKLREKLSDLHRLYSL